MDIAQEFSSYGEDVVKALSDPKIAEAVGKYVDAAKAPTVTKNTELLGEVKTFKALIESLGGVEAAKALHQAKVDAETKAREAAAKSDNVETLRQHFATEIKTRDDKYAALLNRVRDSHVKSVIATALTEAGGDAKLLGPHIASRVEPSVNDDGEVSITILNGEGKPWLIGSEGKAATLKDLLDEMKADTSFRAGFSASGSRGSGASIHGGGTLPTNPWQKGASFNLTKQMEIARNTPELAKALKLQAGIAA